MQRHEFLIPPRQEDVRTERRRGRHGVRYCGAGGSSLTSSAWLSFLCPATEYDITLTAERQESCPDEPPPGPVSAKLLYLDAMQALDRDRLQLNWGRVQQMGEMDYEPVAALAAAIKQLETRLAPSPPQPVLEEFLGFVDQIDGDVAYVTLTSRTGEKLYGEYPAAELKARGIHERRRFKCRTIDAGTRVEFDLEPIPDLKVSEEREHAIEKKVRELLGDDDGPQGDC